MCTFFISYHMHKTKTVLAVLLMFLLLASQNVSAQNRPPRDVHRMDLPANWEQMTPAQRDEWVEDHTPEDFDYPDNWSSLNPEQRVEYIKNHKPVTMRMLRREDLPEEWEDMTRQERENWLRDNRPQGVDLPDDWSDMTPSQRYDYIEENYPEAIKRFLRRSALPNNWGEMTEEAQQEWLTDHKPEGIDLPEGWDEMTPRERFEYIKDTYPNIAKRIRQAALPDNWDDMDEDEREEWLEDHTPRGMEIPDDWEDMTGEERKEYTRENHPGVGDMRRAFVKKARRADRYQRFTGQLREQKEFKDRAKMRNPEAVQFLQQRGILDGYEDGTFGPEKPINRAESLKVLLEALGEVTSDSDEETEFSDVPRGAWYAKYVRKARARGIVKGYEDGTFQPGRTVNQVELLKIAFESFGIDLSDYEVTDLPEGADESAWYAPYLQYALDNNLLDEEDLDLAGGMTREAFSELVYRLIQQQEVLEEDES